MTLILTLEIKIKMKKRFVMKKMWFWLRASRRRERECVLLCLFWLIGACPWNGWPHTPQVACVFYGEVRDEYGIPYTENAEVSLRVQGREISRYKIHGILAPGVNFRLFLPLDDGFGEPYDSYAARPGDSVEIVLVADGKERALTQIHALRAGKPGALIPVYVSIGEDSDQDGLPDAWEWELIRNSNGELSDLASVRPEDDFDGDGMSNWKEYEAGTLAFLPEDVLAVEEISFLNTGMVRLRFLTVPGISYQLQQATQVGSQADWKTVPFALVPTEKPQYQALIGNGFYVDLYVPIEEGPRFYRLKAQ